MIKKTQYIIAQNVAPGSTIQSIITITNQGNLIFDKNIFVTYVTYPVTPVVTISNVSADIGEATVDNNTIKWSGSLNPHDTTGKTTIINAMIKIADNAPDNQVITSTVTAVEDWNFSEDSILVATERVVKPVEPSNIITNVNFDKKNPVAGDKFNSIVTLENTGGTDYTTDQIIDITLSNSEAFSLGEATATLGEITVNNNTFTVKATIKPSETQTITVPVEALNEGKNGDTITTTLTKPTGTTSGTLTSEAIFTIPEIRVLYVKNNFEAVV